MMTDNSKIGCLKDEAIKLYYPITKNAFHKYEEDCNFTLTDASGKKLLIISHSKKYCPKETKMYF